MDEKFKRDTSINFFGHFIFILVYIIKIKSNKHYELQSGEWNLTQRFEARVTTTIMIEMEGRQWYLTLAARLRDRGAASRLPRDTSKALLKVYHLG